MTAEEIAALIAGVDSFVTPIVKDADPAVGAGVALAFKLLAAAEPSAYKAIQALVSGQPLTADQQEELNAIKARLADPGQYFAD